jgi:hypothetical protein
VEDERVDVVRAEVLERARERLLHLGGNRGLRVVWKTLILPREVGELGLQEQLVPRDAGAGDRGADPGLEVMLPLVRGIDGSEPGLQGKRDQLLGALFFPGGAVPERRGVHGDRVSW